LSGDPERLSQVLEQLLENAIKFTEAGKIEISCKLADLDEDSATLQYEIHDTGIGISPEEITAIFEPLTQVDGSTTRRYGGIGMGLIVCKLLADRHFVGG